MVDKTPETPGTHDEAPDKTESKDKESFNEESIKKIVQSETDRIRTEYSKKLKAAEAEAEALRKEKMSADQVKEYERKRLEEELSKKEKELNDREISIHARDKLIAEGLDISFVDYVKGSTPEETDKRIMALKLKFQEALSKAIDDKLKGAGREPNKGRDQSGTSDISGMTPEQIRNKARGDPEWFRKNETEILALTAEGKFKR